MTNQRKYSLVILITTFSLGWIACSQQRQVCLTPKTSFLNVESIHFATDTATVTVDTSLPGAVFIPLTNSSAIGYFFGKQFLFTLSLSPNDSECKWIYMPDSSKLSTHIFDTLTFRYKGSPHFISNACGYTYYYSLRSVQTTHTYTDSAHIKTTSVTNDIKPTHVQIYIHPGF
jgi:Family of unknown function (DUF6452)